MSEGLMRRAMEPCRRPPVVCTMRRTAPLTVATGAFSTSRRRLRGTATAARVLISISTKLDGDRMGAGLPSWKPIYFDRTYRQERWLLCSSLGGTHQIHQCLCRRAIVILTTVVTRGSPVSIDTKQESHDTLPAPRPEILRRSSMPTQQEEAL